MSNPLKPGGRVGIIGGGQLGRMSAMAAAEMGYHCHILSPVDDAPALEVARSATIGAYDDPDVLKSFAEKVDVVTFEFENIPSESLELLESLRPVHPSRTVLEVSQDRIREKTVSNEMGLRTAPWVEVHDAASLHALPERLGFPLILKQNRFGYDGKGQWRVRDINDLYALPENLPYPLIAEGYVDFAREVSVIVARDYLGGVRCFTVTENRHIDGILDLSLAPARITPELASEAEVIATHVAQHMSLIGVLAVEMFMDADGKLLINEIAPRPHNSGHWTQDACLISQFTAHIMMVTGHQICSLARHSDAVMKNLIGPATFAKLEAASRLQHTRTHLYGKKEARPGRKMGHVNILFPKDALPGELGLDAALGPLL